ncbi:MAG: transcriptional repressor [Neomegalonema sp.]
MSKQGEQMRANVLRVLRQRDAPMSAYDLLRELQSDAPRLAPTTIYRALEKLVERGSVHRLESLNAFMACRCEGPGDMSVLAICDDCGAVEENLATSVHEQLSNIASQSGFEPGRRVVEIHGRCASCTVDEVHS